MCRSVPSSFGATRRSRPPATSESYGAIPPRTRRFWRCVAGGLFAITFQVYTLYSRFARDGGLEADDCGLLLRAFFRERR